MARPSSLVVSCCDKDPKELVQLILGHDDLPSPIPLIESIEAYPWFIETKYYTADIYLCTVKNKTIGNQEFAESVQAVVIYFDSKLESTFDKVKEWMTFIKEFSPEVQLLVCDNFTESTGVDRQTVQQWCLKNNFELVELNPDVDEDDCDDDFPETTGIKRVIQALHSHLWPNLELKNEPGFKKLNLESALDASPKELPSDISTFNSTNDLEKSFKDLSVAKSEVEECKETQGATESDQSTEKAKFSDVMPSDFDVSHILGDEDSSTQSFELLFQQFHQMKERAQNLPFEERKTYAEQVALAFWRAIGGDEEEIEGIEHE